MVPLTAAAVVENRLAAVFVANRREARRDLADRGIPVNLLEGSVRAPAQRLGQPVRSVLVEVEAMRLLACVASRRRVRVVAAKLHQAATILASELNLDSAVALAQDAGRRFPFRHNISFG